MFGMPVRTSSLVMLMRVYPLIMVEYMPSALQRAQAMKRSDSSVEIEIKTGNVLEYNEIEPTAAATPARGCAHFSSHLITRQKSDGCTALAESSRWQSRVESQSGGSSRNCE
jgi:hypothetical protein